jgi:L-glyceraldehyde 3-phosphate reductase
MNESMLDDETLDRIRVLNEIAKRRGQSLAQMAILWVLRDPRVTSALIGASSVRQLEDSLKALDGAPFDAEELAEIDRYAGTLPGVDLWASSSKAGALARAAWARCQN